MDLLEYNTDKGLLHHNYGRQYEDLLKKYKNIKYLEIGVYKGGSLEAMKQLLETKLVVGLDIDSSCKRDFVEIGDATDKNFIYDVISKYGTFDIILDDGSHINKDIIQSFEILFPLLNDNGLYIVEDTCVYNYDEYNCKEYPNVLDYFANLTKYLNQTRKDSSTGIKDYCSDPYKIIKKTDNVFEYSIDKIEFGCSFIAIHKKIRHHWIK